MLLSDCRVVSGVPNSSEKREQSCPAGMRFAVLFKPCGAITCNSQQSLSIVVGYIPSGSLVISQRSHLFVFCILLSPPPPSRRPLHSRAALLDIPPGMRVQNSARSAPSIDRITPPRDMRKIFCTSEWRDY